MRSLARLRGGGVTCVGRRRRHQRILTLSLDLGKKEVASADLGKKAAESDGGWLWSAVVVVSYGGRRWSLSRSPVGRGGVGENTFVRKKYVQFRG